MSANLIFPQGIPVWPSLDNTNFRWMLLLSTFVPDPDVQVFVADVVADEATDASYARQTLSGAAQAFGVVGDVDYDADDVVFGALVGGEAVAWCVLFEFVTNDADSILMAAYRIAKVTDGSATTVVFDPSGICSFVRRT